MKKALALVLALVLALSLGVSAFALEFIDLTVESTTPEDKVTVETLENYEGYEKYFRADAKGGDYYLLLQDKDHPERELKNFEVTTTGPVSAEIVKYDADKMSGYQDNADWYLTKNGKKVEKADLTEKEQAAYTEVYNDLKDSKNYNTKGTGSFVWVLEDGNNAGFLTALEINGKTTYGEFIYKKIVDEKMTPAKALKAALANWKALEGYLKELKIAGVKEETQFDDTTEKFNKALAKGLNAELRTSKFSASTEADGVPMLKLTVEPNYTAAYKMGSFKVTAKRVDEVDDKERATKTTKVAFKGYVVSDVTIFEYEEVKWAGKEDEALIVGEKGYSDFWMSGVYSKYDEETEKYEDVYNEEYLRSYDDATVVSTTAFRALRENKYGVKVKAGELLVTVPEIVSGQKGVNFAYKDKAVGNKESSKVDNLGVSLGEGLTAVYTDKYHSALESITFGFYGNQTIASDFTVEADLGIDAYQLREAFGEKVEEEDIITYYIVEGDKVVGQFTVDYMKDDIDENLVLEINRKAGSTLGMYKIVTEAPAAAETPAEENPNTGAESVIGVVAAMAVVSVAAAAAVSLKK